MKATRKNLIENGIINEKLMNYLEFGDEIGFFIKINGQRTQNMGHDFSKEDLDKAYNDYLNDTRLFNFKKMQKILENKNIYFYKKLGKGIYNLTCWLYFKDKNTLEKRIFRKINKSENYSIKLNNEWIEILDINFSLGT